MRPCELDSRRPYQELHEWCEDESFLHPLQTCIQAQKRAASSVFRSAFQPDDRALDAVSEQSLRAILESGRDVHGIASDRSISNVIVFNGPHIQDAVLDEAVLETRRMVDQVVSDKVRHMTSSKTLEIACSGHLWYPPGAYMGWHTNSRSPGWRLYVSYAEKPGKSFFRYRDPDTRDIITSWDERWNVRLFEVRSDKPLWHAIYSETHRFSVGYVIYPRSFGAWAGDKLKRALNA
ncbi:MAG: hypothetical protein ACREJU_04730 [Nitrospiraceae bacterium]